MVYFIDEFACKQVLLSSIRNIRFFWLGFWPVNSDRESLDSVN
jgi:hypothetical protein